MKNQFTDGIHNLTNEQYHASSAISRSSLMLLNKSPYHLWYELFSGESIKEAPTQAMNIGSAFHTMLLEPKKFDEEFAVMPAIDRRTNAGKELYKEFQELNGHKIILTLDQYEDILVMVEHIRKHDIVTNLLNDAMFEKSIFWTDKETGLQFKCKPDVWSEKMVVDIKTTSDSNEYMIKRSSMQYGYYLQAGMMYEGCKALGKPFEMFVHVFCEKTKPYVPAVYIMNDEALQFGIDQFMKLKKILSECIQTDKWEGYPVKELGVPQYVLNQINEE